MAYRDKNIEDLKQRYSDYLDGLNSSAIGYLAEDPELYIEPVDEISPVLDKLYKAIKETPAEYDDSMDYRAGIEYAIEALEGIL